jgi:hypothetical protein
MVHPPKDIQPIWQQWEALESTWASIPMEWLTTCRVHMPQQIEAVLRAKDSSRHNRFQISLNYTRKIGKWK